MDATELPLLETNVLMVDSCIGGWAHERCRHYSVTEAEVCADDFSYAEWMADGMAEQMNNDPEWYRDLDTED